MTVSSYVYQSPYSSPMQIGRPDPLSKSSEDVKSIQSLSKDQSVLPQKSPLTPTLSSNNTINISALSGSQGVQAANAFNAANTKVQAQNAYQSI
ncbi:MAG: hypothetical protein PHO27_08235 [Sulfuricurvum sp.]|nr:hypothetical protein [Sulfuricurvum sp.]